MSIIDGEVLVIAMVCDYYCFDDRCLLAFLSVPCQQHMASRQRFWWFWENEIYDNEMTIENDIPSTCFLLAFLI